MNLLRGPGFGNWDVAVFKNFRWMEGRMNAQFRVEAFNLPNHPNLSNPNSNPRGGFFGVITGKSGERNLQLGFKVSLLNGDDDAAERISVRIGGRRNVFGDRAGLPARRASRRFG